MVKDKVDILALTETTLDCSFVNQQFCIERYCLHTRYTETTIEEECT